MLLYKAAKPVSGPKANAVFVSSLMSVLFPSPFHMSSLPFPFSGLSPPYTYQVIEVNEIRAGLQPPYCCQAAADLP